MFGRAIREKVLRSQTKVLLDDDYPKYMDRKIKRLDSMDFSPSSMMKDIQKAIAKSEHKKVKNMNKYQRKALNKKKLVHMPTFMGISRRKQSLLQSGSAEKIEL